MISIKKLKEEFDELVSIYVHEFCKKQGLQFDWWVNDQVASIGNFGDYYFDFLDIKFDIDTKQEKDKILEWYDYTLNEKNHNVNYATYVNIKK